MEAELAALLPAGVQASQVETAQGLSMHVLEAGHERAPVLLLLHGFPELAFSWRKVMPALAEAGYRVIAPDQRGYGRTNGWAGGFEVDLAPYRMPSLVLDQLALLSALGIKQVHGVIGHDFGSPVAAWSALIRPDVFSRVVMMSAPFGGAPGFGGGGKRDIDAELATLDVPRKHYQWYYSTAPANADMLECKQGLKQFLAQYYYLKSGLWAGNGPLADEALDFYCSEFARTGFQGGLNWYRASTSPAESQPLRLYSGARITVPALFIGGDRDWGIYQTPGSMKAMADRVCSDFRGQHLIRGAGHWVQQEDPDAVVAALLPFLSE